MPCEKNSTVNLSLKIKLNEKEGEGQRKIGISRRRNQDKLYARSSTEV